MGTTHNDAEPSDRLEHRGSVAHGPSSDRLYVVVWAVLLALTGVTVGVSALDMKKFAVFGAMVIAATKALLVLLYFMHVRWEPRLIPVMIGVALAGLACFFGLTFADLVYRYP